MSALLPRLSICACVALVPWTTRVPGTMALTRVDAPLRLFNYAYVGIVLILFLRFFYYDNFVKKSKKKAAAKSKDL